MLPAEDPEQAGGLADHRLHVALLKSKALGQFFRAPQKPKDGLQHCRDPTRQLASSAMDCNL